MLQEEQDSAWLQVDALLNTMFYKQAQKSLTIS